MIFQCYNRQWGFKNSLWKTATQLETLKGVISRIRHEALAISALSGASVYIPIFCIDNGGWNWIRILESGLLTFFEFDTINDPTILVRGYVTVVFW